MKKFKFSLQAVRALKRRLEDEAAQKHAAALVQVGRAKAQLAEAEKELNAAALLMYSGQGRSTAKEILQLSQYVAVLEKLRKERMELCFRAEKEVTLARAQLEKVAREREILEKLYERHKAEHTFHVARQEQKWIDEIALQIKQGLLAGI